MGKGNHNLDHMSSNLLPLTLGTACIPNTTLRRSFFPYDSLVSLLVGSPVDQASLIKIEEFPFGPEG